LVDAVGEEHRAVRERVGLFDQTSFAKFLVVGRDAETALSWIAANDVAKPVGSLVYTQMLNKRGGIECDLTVSRLAEDTYYIVTGTGFATQISPDQGQYPWPRPADRCDPATPCVPSGSTCGWLWLPPRRHVDAAFLLAHGASHGTPARPRALRSPM
jgi:hypothetical protein